MAEKKKEENEEKAGKALAGGKSKLIIFAALGLVLLAALGAGGYYLGTRSPATPGPSQGNGAKQEAKGESSAHAGDHDNKSSGPMVPIEEFIVNLLDKDSNHYLKATMSLEVDSEAAAKEITGKMPKIRDAILLLAGNKTIGELRDLQGKMQLRAEIVGHLNTLLEQGKITHIYITSFVIQ